MKKDWEKLKMELGKVGMGRYWFRKRLHSVLLTSTMLLAAILVKRNSVSHRDKNKTTRTFEHR